MTPAVGFGLIAGIFAVACFIVGMTTAAYNDNSRHHGMERSYLATVALGSIAAVLGIFAVVLAVHW